MKIDKQVPPSHFHFFMHLVAQKFDLNYIKKMYLVQILNSQASYYAVIGVLQRIKRALIHHLDPSPFVNSNSNYYFFFIK